MRLTVKITLSEEDSQNAENSFECNLSNVVSGVVFGGFTWRGDAKSPEILSYSITGDFIGLIKEVDIEISSSKPFEYNLDVGVD